MKSWLTTSVSLAIVGIGILLLSSSPPAAAADKPAQPDQAAVERARKLVHLLDDIYKQTIVLITDKYVHSEKDFAAGSAAVGLFATLSKSGTHEVRLIDATGEPYEPKNVANDEFEKAGLARLKAGDGYYDQVTQREGKFRLRAITAVPVVMQKCVMCHAHYADVKKGEPIGAIVYSVPIE